MLRVVFRSVAAIIAAVSAAAGWLWWDHLRVHGTAAPIEFQSADGITLRGDIYLPSTSGRSPAVVFLHGSGPHVAGMAPYRIHANAFLKQGVAVLLYDKRGAGRSGGDFDTATYADFIQDALAGVEALRARPDIVGDRIGLFGSSEGGWFTPEVAERDGNIKFIINRAGPTLPWIETNLWEIRNELLECGVKDETLIRKILNLRVDIWTYYLDAAEANAPLLERRAILEARLAALDGPWREAYAMRVADFDPEKYRRWAVDISYDPGPHLAQLTPPLYAIYAGADQNVPTKAAVAMLERLRDERGKDITIKIYPGRRHGMFKWRNIMSAGYPPGYLSSIGDWAAEQANATEKVSK